MRIRKEAIAQRLIIALLRQQTRLLLPFAFLMGAGMWIFFDHVIIPGQVDEAAAHNSPRGNLSDLYPSWLGARELLLHGRDPYSPEITADIQDGIWGREVNAGHPGDPTDQSRFVYPLYIVFLLAPTVTWSFRAVRLFYMVFGAAVSVASVWFWLRFLGEKHSGKVALVASTLLLGSYSVVQALHVQQPALLAFGLIAGAMSAVSAGYLTAAGVLLALATMKPQITVAISSWLLLWSLSGWRERKRLVLSFAGAMAILVIGAELLLPGWISEWRNALTAYQQYAPLNPAHIQLVFGNGLGKGLGILIVLAIASFCWRARLDTVTSERFRFIPPLILTTTLILNPVWHSYDQMLLLPAALLAFHWRQRVHGLTTLEKAVFGVSAFAVGWQWIAASALCITSLVAPALARSLEVLPWLSILFGPACALLSLILLARLRLSEG